MLDNFDKTKKPFKIPENYFENFNAKIMEQLPVKEDKIVKVVPMWKKVLPWTAVAAVIFGILFSIGVFDKGNMPSDKVYANQNKVATTYSDFEEEEDYYLYLQDEVMKAQLDEMFYNY